jgi:hypothetical protein
MTLKKDNTTFEARPISFDDLKTHYVKIVLKTSNEEVFFPFTVTVSNSPPIITNLPLP